MTTHTLDATRGKFADVDEVIQKNGCSNDSFVAVRQYEVDPSGAERLLRDRSDSQDLAFGLDQFAAVAARKGNIIESLRLLNDLQNVSRARKMSYLLRQEPLMRFMRLLVRGPSRIAPEQFSSGPVPDRQLNSKPGL